ALVAGVPEGIADDDDVRRSRSVFTGEEGPAENRLDASIADSVRANGSAIDGFGMSVVREVEHDVLEDGGVLEDVSELTDIVVLRDREKPGTSLLAIEACEDGDPAAVIFEIERKNKRGFPHAVESGGRSDAKGENENANEGEAAGFYERASADADVL